MTGINISLLLPNIKRAEMPARDGMGQLITFD